MVKCLINQIAALIKVSILNATNRESVGSSVIGIEKLNAVEVEGDRRYIINCTAPIVAAGTDSVERTITVAAAARYGQFKW